VTVDEELRIVKAKGLVAWIVGHFPPGQFGRYLTVGAVNTLFGYGSYAGLTAVLTPHIPFAYLLANIIAGFLSISFAFLNYKWFVFKTKGSYLREWTRCMLVYGTMAMLGTALLAPTVFALRWLGLSAGSAPYVAGALLTCTNVFAGFLGHKRFSFAPRSSEAIR